MATPIKVEFAVQMTCQSCVDAVEKALKETEGVQSVSVNLAQEQVVVESTLTSFQIQEILENTGRRAVLKGQGSKATHLGAAVSVLETSAQVKGVVRLTQVDENTCVIEGTIDGLMPGEHGLAIHEYGDISDGCNSCGGHFNPHGVEHGGPSQPRRHVGDLGNITAAENGRARFRIEDDQLKVWDVIGRSCMVHENPDDLGKGSTPQSHTDGNSGAGLACGIIARSAGLFENTKKICACDGVTLWDERDVPAAGPGRQQHSSYQSNL